MISQSQILEGARLRCAPLLTPKLAPWMQRFMEDPSLALGLVAEFGSPLHIVVTEEFNRNVRDLLEPLKRRGLSGGLYFARKANKLPWFVQSARECGIGVDTASLTELHETLALGMPPHLVITTAIGKGRQLVELAVANGCLVIIDNEDELKLVAAVSEAIGRKARVGLRFSGFVVGDRKVFSRFGFSVDCQKAAIDSALASDWLQLETLHAHLDRYDVTERARAARKLIDIASAVRARGGAITSIDLGGGILMRYLESAEKWNDFQEALVEQIKGERPYFTYQNDGLGYFRADHAVGGKADLYPAWNPISKERFIAAILDQTEGDVPLWRDIKDAGLTLFFEPGRALLDNAGITMAAVTFRKRDVVGNLLIGADMNRTNLRPFRAEFCSDPALLYEGERENLNEGAFIVGNLCSESDLIFRRRLRLAVHPEPGDIFVFANSAGYLSHHMEIGTHGSGLPKNIWMDRDNLTVKAVHD